jgi:MFS transporter, DHA3 family, macrolide efflux protein
MTEYASLHGNPGFVRLWSARVISRFGSALGYVVLLWITFAQTGSALAVAYVGIAEFLPTVAVGIFTGALVDRYDRRRVIILSSLGRSAAMAGLILALYAAGFHLIFVLLAAAVFSLCATFFGPGAQALLPELVPREALAHANGLFESTESIVGIAGSAAGGLLIVLVGAVPSLGVDAASYLFGAICIALIGATAISTPTRSPSGTSPGLAAEVAEGFRFLRGSLGLLEVTLVASVLNFLISFLMGFIVVYSAVVLHGSALVYGGIEAALAAGWAVGGLVVGRLGLTRRVGLVWAASAFVEGLVLVGIVTFPVVPLAVAAFVGLGISQGVVNVAWLSTVQAIVPERLQGRYFALETAISYAAIPLSQIVGGVLIVVYGVPFTFVAAGLGSIATGAIALLFRELRRIGYDPKASSVPATPASP